MIIYGSGSAHLNTVMSENTTCPSCEKKGTVALSVYSRHAHIFWIPLFPIGKKGGGKCQHCGYQMEKKEMPEDIQREYYNLKKSGNPRIWQFAGLGIIAVIIVASLIAGMQDSKQEAEYLAEPMQNDVYRYKTETENYSSMRVAAFTGDSIYIYLNDYETNKRSRVSEIDKTTNYTEMYAFSLQEIQEMYDEGTIYDISR